MCMGRKIVNNPARAIMIKPAIVPMDGLPGTLVYALPETSCTKKPSMPVLNPRREEMSKVVITSKSINVVELSTTRLIDDKFLCE